MKNTITGRCYISIDRDSLVLDTTWGGFFSDETAYENVVYEERDGKLFVHAEQLRPCMYNAGFGGEFATDNIDDLHPSRIHTKLVRKYWLFGPLVEKRYAESGWQRLKNNRPLFFESSNYTIITAK